MRPQILAVVSDEAVADAIFIVDIGRAFGIWLNLAPQMRYIDAGVMVLAGVFWPPNFLQ